MEFADIFAIIVIAMAVGGALFYIIREKKRGARCIGCPHSGKCKNHCQCSVNIDGEKDT